MSKRDIDLVEALLAAAKESGQSAYALAKGSGLDRGQMVRFLNRDRNLSLESAARLAEYLKLELRRKEG